MLGPSPLCGHAVALQLPQVRTLPVFPAVNRPVIVHKAHRTKCSQEFPPVAAPAGSNGEVNRIKVPEKPVPLVSHRPAQERGEVSQGGSRFNSKAPCKPQDLRVPRKINSDLHPHAYPQAEPASRALSVTVGRDSIQASTSELNHPTARTPTLRGGGKSPSVTMR